MTQQGIQKTMNEFVGKTIKEVVANSANMWTFKFTDGTFVSIETEYFGHGIYGIVPDLKTELPLPKVA